MSDLEELDSHVSRRSLLTRTARSGLSLAVIGSVDGLFGITGAADRVRPAARRAVASRLRAAGAGPERDPVAARGLLVHDRGPVRRDAARQR